MCHGSDVLFRFAFCVRCSHPLRVDIAPRRPPCTVCTDAVVFFALKAKCGKILLHFVFRWFRGPGFTPFDFYNANCALQPNPHHSENPTKAPRPLGLSKEGKGVSLFSLLLYKKRGAPFPYLSAARRTRVWPPRLIMYGCT